MDVNTTIAPKSKVETVLRVCTEETKITVYFMDALNNKITKVGVMAESYTVKRSTQCKQTEVMPMFKTLMM